MAHSTQTPTEGKHWNGGNLKQKFISVFLNFLFPSKVTTRDFFKVFFCLFVLFFFFPSEIYAETLNLLSKPRNYLCVCVPLCLSVSDLSLSLSLSLTLSLSLSLSLSPQEYRIDISKFYVYVTAVSRCIKQRISI